MVDSRFLSPLFVMHLTFVEDTLELNSTVDVYLPGTQTEMVKSSLRKLNGH